MMGQHRSSYLPVGLGANLIRGIDSSMLLPFCGKKIESCCSASCLICTSDFSMVADRAPPEYVGSFPVLCKSVTRASKESDETLGRTLRAR